MKAFVIAGERSGCGKTLVSLGIMAALIKRGHVVQPFKVGPDFIDPGHHERVTGRPSHNLDGWMTGPDGVANIFSRYAAGADVAVIEGVMGLFDGASGKLDDGSTAQIAKWLGAPVALVLDASSLARSAAALAHGYLSYDPDLDVAALIMNKVGSENHKNLLFDALSTVAAPDPQRPFEIAGFLPRDEGLAMPSRHLGLVTDQDGALSNSAVDRLGNWADENLNLPRLMAVLPEVELAPAPVELVRPKTCRIAVAKDRAFCFYYRENLRMLEQFGAKLDFFSPLEDPRLPRDADALYLGGGYPELHAEALSGNTAMIADIRDFSAAGKPVYAECGGFMYLMRSLTDLDGRTLPMAGVFDMRAKMRPRFQALGYREVVTHVHCAFGPPWTMLRGHEFHYSAPEAPDPESFAVYKVADRNGWTDQMEGFLKGNTLGSYIHLHFASNPEAAEHFVAWCAGEITKQE
jgi:cobyrinic acid a,c-diamide synthase